MPLSAGGDHLITLPIMRGIRKGLPPLGMVHFDAHSDTWDSYFGGYKYTHGTPFRRAVEEGLLDPKRVVQIGIRGSLYKGDDNDWAVEQGMRVITIEEYFDLGVDKVIAEARRVVGDGPTYVSFDVDGLDPAYAPGTGTPEIGGYTPHEAQRMLRGLRGLNLVGGDVVEVSPPFDMSGNTALVGVTMMWEILCLLAEAVASGRAGSKVARATPVARSLGKNAPLSGGRNLAPARPLLLQKRASCGLVAGEQVAVAMGDAGNGARRRAIGGGLDALVGDVLPEPPAAIGPGIGHLGLLVVVGQPEVALRQDRIGADRLGPDAAADTLAVGPGGVGVDDRKPAGRAIDHLHEVLGLLQPHRVARG